MSRTDVGAVSAAASGVSFRQAIGNYSPLAFERVRILLESLEHFVVMAGTQGLLTPIARLNNRKKCASNVVESFATGEESLASGPRKSLFGAMGKGFCI